MALSAFDDRSRTPNKRELADMLGRTHSHWETLRSHVASHFDPITEEWKFSGAKYGWSLQLKQKKRTVLYLVPCKRHFLAAFALGEKAVTAAHESDLSEDVFRVIDSAPKYAEGRGVRLEVRNKKDVAEVQKLAAIKMAN